MKPRIKRRQVRSGPAYECRCAEEVGLGATPAQAYRAWEVVRGLRERVGSRAVSSRAGVTTPRWAESRYDPRIGCQCVLCRR